MAGAEFRASRTETAGLSGLMAALCAASVVVAWITWTAWIWAGIDVFLALAFGFGVAILGYRLVAKPVMVRISADGIYLKRLSTLIPWEAIGRVERVAGPGGKPLLSIRERDTGHPVFDGRPLILGAALNEKAGLPALAISPDGLDGSLEAIIAAIELQGGIEVGG